MFDITVPNVDENSNIMVNFKNDQKVIQPKNFREWLVQSDCLVSQSFLPNPDHSPKVMNHLPTLIIGAGPAGLSAMWALKQLGLPFEATERSADIGGIWNAENPDSPAYDELLTISSKVTTHLDQPMPRSWPAYLNRAKAYEYLQDFVRRNDLKEGIQFNTQVETLKKTSRGTWSVVLQKSNSTQEKEYRSVIISAGTLNKSNKRIPQDLWKSAQLAGIPSIHTADFKNAHDYENKNVLVVGIGNSGADIAAQISRVARQTFLAVRTSPWIVPLWAFGKPSDAFAKSFGVPYSVQMKVFHAIQRWYIGHPTQLGFTAPRHDLLDMVPICDRGIVAAIRQKKIQIRSTVREIKNGRVYFTEPSDSSEQIDKIIFATGYTKNYPFLPAEFGHLDDPHFKLIFQIFHPTEPGLLFMPNLSVHQGGWPLFFEQAKAIAAYLQIEERNPRKFSNFLNRRNSTMPNYKGKLFRATDDYNVDAETYSRLLRDFRVWISAY